MINEVTRLMDRWLHHETYGVQAQLGKVPRKVPSEAAEDVYDGMPIMPTIYNDVEDESVADKVEPAATPALVVFAFTGAQFDLDSGSERRQIGRNLTIAIAYVTREVPVLEARRNAGYTLRAVRWSLGHLNSVAKSSDYRSLNGVQIAQVSRARELSAYQGVGLSTLWGFVFVDVLAVDSLA